jgi:hypothetical protein
MQEGASEWDDEYWIWSTTKRFEAWLIVIDPRKKPVFALPEDVELVEMESDSE